ncbi:type II secretion system protein GspE [Pseudomonas sp. SWI6]|uniref:GspE/PulE family protein n=1 Tax=Pseudomonas TaxID=286 RepID=UPI00041B8949|nr:MULTISPECIES: ATPase, T2SS/T4P/T4SS family [Pseudomonas]AVD81892.1 type II secretion system protein GspE [Pseudomonas sp. SWI6]MBC3492027.1 Flp pilus assembly complex ATPase component TadA [Pseudomonas taiwanensis]MPT00414.1 type II secretion system protein GspE [Pseudomonas sp.]WEZ91139.1 ATPase, T2SS/T4P/T4SS family [Pseudomonas sp. NyZ480]
MLPYRLARHAGLAIAPAESGWQLWLRHGADSCQLQELLRVHGQPSALQYLAPDAFDARLGQLYQAGEGANEALIEGIGEQVDLDSLISDMPRIEDLLESDDEAPVIRLINGLFGQALRLRASDIHIETFEQSLVVRLRVDGHLREVLRPPRALSAMLVSRIKVMARLDIAEKRQPQDGRITLRAAGREVDVRVSTLPGIHGERVVMRVLDKQASLLALDNLGMPAAVLQGLRACLARPNGIVLSTGPTGSGKTTTLYASLNGLNDGSRNILTVEDPVEYAITGIGQTAINPRAGLTFANGLRAILRQDPDVIMLGEIRDQETAQIAVQASLTGHLVLSTLHTNSAVGAVTRLRDMGIEPFLIASCLRGVLAQRLVRRLCHCAVAHPLQVAEREMWPELATLGNSYHPVGCADCQGSGYVGRIGLYEFVELDAGLIGLLYDGASEVAMHDYLAPRRQSLLAMASDCLASGQTSLAEVLRVVQG